MLLPEGSEKGERNTICTASRKILQGSPVDFLLCLFEQGSVTKNWSRVHSPWTSKWSKREKISAQTAIHRTLYMPSTGTGKSIAKIWSPMMLWNSGEEKSHEKNDCQVQWEKAAKYPAYHSPPVQPLRHLALCCPCTVTSRPLQAIPKCAAGPQISPDTGLLSSGWDTCQDEKPKKV